MANDRKLRLRLIDAYGDVIGGVVDIFLRPHGSGETRQVRNANASKTIVIGGLPDAPSGPWEVEVDPPSYLPIKRFVNLGSMDPSAFLFAIDAQKVISVDFPVFTQLSETAHTLLSASSSVLNFAGINGSELYSALDDLRKAGMLNIFAKTSRTRFSDQSLVSSYLCRLQELRQDRFFVEVKPELLDHTLNSVPSGLFYPVPAILHTAPPGFAGAGSFKTDDRYGNLQLTFWRSADTMVADIDIDDAAGLEHVFQVTRNALTGRPTHPYNIQQILLATQEIDPGYRLLVSESKPKVITARGQT